MKLAILALALALAPAIAEAKSFHHRGLIRHGVNNPVTRVVAKVVVWIIY